MSLSDLHIRAGELAGKIKQADADVAESTLMVQRARDKLTLEESALEKHIARAAELRERRGDLQREAQELLACIGEPAGVSGEGVSTSADVGGGDEPSPADVFNQGIETVKPWTDVPEPIFGDGPAPEYATR